MTNEGMNHPQGSSRSSISQQSISQKVSDIEAFGQAFNMMMNLSKYLDTAANSVLGGTLEITATAPFVRRAASIYAELRGTILGLILDEDIRSNGETMLRKLEGDVDVLEAALILDQSHCWLETSVRHGAFSHRVKLLDLQLGLEEAAANAQLSEQREKAELFEKRGTGGKNVGGTYV